MDLRQAYFEIQQALYQEARALDEGRFVDWLEFFADDASYWMPIRQTVSANERQLEFTKPGEAALFDEDKKMLEARVFKLGTGFSWSEDPPSRTRHIITNIEIISMEENGQCDVTSNFITYRSRLDVQEDWWVGRRADRFRKVDERWRIVRREIYLDDTVLKSKNLSTFF